MDKFFEVIRETPFRDQVHELYDPAQERIQGADYRLDLQLIELKRSL